MLRYALILFVVASIAALPGFTGIAGAATNIAWILFIVFLVLAAIAFLRGRRPATVILLTGPLHGVPFFASSVDAKGHGLE